MKSRIGVTVGILTATVFVGLAFSVAVVHLAIIPNLAPEEAQHLISMAPEFNRFAAPVHVVSVRHFTGSMASISAVVFSFRYLDSPAHAAPIKARADFRYWEGSWHLNQFDYGCPGGCHFVQVSNEVPK